MVVLFALPLPRAGAAQSVPQNERCGHPLEARADSLVWGLVSDLEGGPLPSRKRAIARLRAAARLAPFTWEGWTGFIQLTRIVRAPDEGVRLAEESVRRWPHCAPSRVALAYLLAIRGFDAAMDAARTLPDTFPGDPLVEAGAARVWATMGEFRAAAYCFRRAVALDSTFLSSHRDFREAYEATARMLPGLPPLPPDTLWRRPSN
jgi:hypothetical protein